MTTRARKAGGSIYARRIIEFIEGSGATITVTEDAVEGTVKIEIAASGGGVDYGETGDMTGSAFADSADGGASTEVSRADHRHAREADPVTAHVAAGDPHTGYRLESADHSHATTGLQGGQVAHSALSGIAATDHHAAPAAGPDADITVDAAGAAGTASTFARSAPGPKLATTSAAAAAIGTAAAGTSTTAPSRGDHVHPTGAGTPSTQAFGDAAATGSGPAAAMTDHKHAMPASPVTAHVAAGDPHTQYRLEADDHTHASSGAQAGQVAHSALSGISATDHHVAPAAGPDADITVDAAGAAGTASTFARSGHGHKLVTSSSAPGAIASSGAAGTSGVAPSRGDHTHAHEAAHVAHDTLFDAAGDLVVGTGADTAAKLALTVPAANIVNALAVVNGETTPTWRALLNGTNPPAIGTAAPGTSLLASHQDHVHATGAGTPSTQAFGDAAATGSGPAAAMTDHKHAMPADPVTAHAAAGDPHTGYRLESADHSHASTGLQGGTIAHSATTGQTANDHHNQAHGAADHTDITRALFLPAGIAKLDAGTAANVGASPDLTGVVALADAATQGCFWTFQVPSDWASGVITVQPVWSPGSTDAVAHTVRWSMVAKTVPNAVSVTAAGTTATFTGASLARTAGTVVYDTATSTTLTPAAAGDLFRLAMRRIGADAADTYVGVVNLLGVIVTYTANQ